MRMVIAVIVAVVFAGGAALGADQHKKHDPHQKDKASQREQKQKEHADKQAQKHKEGEKHAQKKDQEKSAEKQKQKDEHAQKQADKHAQKHKEGDKSAQKREDKDKHAGAKQVVPTNQVPQAVLHAFKKDHSNVEQFRVMRQKHSDGLVHFEFKFKDAAGKIGQAVYDAQGKKLG